MPRYVVWVFSVGPMVLSTGVVCGQGYPNKTIRIVTGESAGSTDFAARLVALKDFSPITMLVNSPNILVVHPSVPVKSVKEFIALAKAKPGVLNYATSAVGGATHLATELFKVMAGVDIVNIPYKGGGSSVLGLLSGQVQLMFLTAASATPHIKSGKLRALAVTSTKPSPLAPGLPTVAATVPGYESGGVVAMFAPPRTPAPIISRLNREVVRLLNQADGKEQCFNVGVETVGSSPEQLGATVKSDVVI